MIEMLIVIAIIGILTALSLFGLQNTRETGRDAARKGDLQSIATAVEVFRSDCHRYPRAINFPAVGSPLRADCDGDGNNETYIQEMPGDPVSGNGYFYVDSTTVTYVLCSHLEEPPVPANDISGCGACDPAGCGYRVLNP